MSFSDRISNGWNIFNKSFDIMKTNRSLVILPVISGIAMILVTIPFVAFVFPSFEDRFSNNRNNAGYYLVLFLFYIINYFVVVFFNVALMHCLRSYFKGEKINIKEGLNYSIKNIRIIFSWAVFAATVGVLLKMLQDKLGWLGKILIGVAGIIWNIATFFVVPVLAYEKLGPIDAFKRSSQIMKEKWGESLTGSFSFGLVQFAALLLIALPLAFFGWLLSPVAGIALGVSAAFIIISIINAAESIFIGCVYHSVVAKEQNETFDQELIDELFVSKQK